MANASDARFRRCDESIQSALARLLTSKSLTEIGVSELAREAHVSRSTFYAHYENVGDVYERLVRKAMDDVQTFDERFSCSGGIGKGSCRHTYCEKIRSSDELSGVTGDPRFFSSMMALTGDDPGALSESAAMGIPKVAFDAIRLFQMSGCHAVATSQFAQRSDWEQTRAVIDAFIEGGLEAIRARQR